MKPILCEQCKTTETGITQDGKSKYIKHKADCSTFKNQTSAGQNNQIK